MAKNTSKAGEKTFSEKFKSFLGIKEPTPLNFDHLKVNPYHISVDILQNICPDRPMSIRIKTLKELEDVVLTKRLEDNVIEHMYVRTKDMLQPQNVLEIRHSVFQFYTSVVKGQLLKLGIQRCTFFYIIQNHKIPEDKFVRLELLDALSENGKTTTYFEEEIGPFLLDWCTDLLSSEKATIFLTLIVNLIKHNAAYLDDDLIKGFLRHVCNHCTQTKNEENVLLCVDLMDTILCYSHLPSDTLQIFVATLCLTVNTEKFAQISWKVMRNLLGTSLGHYTVLTLSHFLETKPNQLAPAVLRGSVFFLGMALWGSKKVEALRHTPSAVLPSFRKALDCNHSSVAYEIALSVQRLIKKSGNELPFYVWDIIFDIVEALLKYPELQKQQQYPLAVCVHDLITTIENCNVIRCNDRLYHIIESCSDKRDENSIIQLINHHSQNFHPIQSDFVQNISHLLDKYFKNEKRQKVQLKVLQTLRNIRVTNGYCYEDDALDQTLLHYMSYIDSVPDVVVRKTAVELLLEIAETCITKRYFDILDIIEKVMKSHLESSYQSETTRKKSYADVEAAVMGLINMFEKKLHTLPSSHVIRVYNMLLNYIVLQYRHISYIEGNVRTRRLIIDFLLKMRTNFKKQVGILNNGKVEYSVYVLCDNKDSHSDPSPHVASPAPSSSAVFNFLPMNLSFEEMFKVIITALKEEKDWVTLELMFNHLPKLLQNKALLICGNCNISGLCVTLCTLINDKSRGQFDNMYSAAPRLTRTEYQSQIFPVIAALTAYHSNLEPHIQSMLIRCLQTGLVSSSAKVCIEGLTLCTLEMRQMMVKHMPSVLLKLSQISATVNVAIAVLEFLSNLIRLPPLYVSFVEDQYRSIFAIALPYTNPHKFNQFTVALAHHVIAMWFLKCRIPFRKEFAKYITKGLRSNMSLPLDDEEDKVLVKSESGESSKSSASNDLTNTLHREFLQLGLDLMSRFTFGMSSNAPKRSAIADFLLEKGQKSSWIIGNKIVTITTSGCGTKTFKYGLCEKCYSSCREVCDSMSSDDSETAMVPASEPVKELVHKGRKRHQSAFVPQNTILSETLENNHSAKDDILLHRQKSRPFRRRQRWTTTAATVTSTATTVPEAATDIADDISAIESESTGTYQLCSCWCSGWAEIYTRRPTGNSSWMMRIQNHLFLPTSAPNLPLPAISTLLLPHKPSESDIAQTKNEAEVPVTNTSEEEDTEAAAEADSSCIVSSATSEALTCPKTKVLLRRTNSSPDMNSGWASFKRPLSARKSIIESHAAVVEEQFPLENGSNGEIFHMDEINYRMEENKSPQKLERTKITWSPRCDPGVQKRTSSDLPNIQQMALGNRNSSDITNSFRDRGHTISVMSPNRFGAFGDVLNVQTNKDMHRSGMNPSFVFLQLYDNSFLGSTAVKPMLLRQTEQNLRSLSVIDHIHPYDTHKIGVVFVGEGQSEDEQAILSNAYGSTRYVEFLHKLGNLVSLSDVDQELTYVGGLDVKGYDGRHALVWHDDVMRVAFHVATFMPNLKDDLKRNNKKTHIGNNFVTIVYNESSVNYKIGTIKSQFTRACVVIRPEDYNSNVVTIQLKNKELQDVFGNRDEYIVSDDSLPIFVRQMALHANLASLILDPRQQSAHVSNWLARLRAIKRLWNKVYEECKSKGETSNTNCQSNFFIDDFTNYV